MEIQSLSVDVPAKGCPNSCKFCISRMHKSPYTNHITGDFPNLNYHEIEYLKRLEFARDNGCNTAVITSTGEPLAHKNFLKLFASYNNHLKSPFKWIEVQTSGVYLNRQMALYMRDVVGISTVSLSVSALESCLNAKINGTPKSLYVDLEDTCRIIRDVGLNLRVSINMSSHLSHLKPRQIMKRLQVLGAQQVTLRKLYIEPGDGPQQRWIKEHLYEAVQWRALFDYICNSGNPMEQLPFGAVRYSVEGISTVIDNDCMSTEAKTTAKYLILRPDCKLYTKWDDKGSLLF